MEHADPLVVLRQCLKGVYRMVYDNILKEPENKNLKETRPDVVYKKIKSELMGYTETPMERSVRIQREWRDFEKTKHMTAIEFKTKFIKF